jgi:hypothetical protein
MKHLFSSKMVAVVAAVGAMAAVPAAASANAPSLPSTTVFATAQSTSVLGVPVPIAGTQGFYVTVPVASSDVPQVVWHAIDFTVTGSVAISGTQLVNLYVDPKMVH